MIKTETKQTITEYDEKGNVIKKTETTTVTTENKNPTDPNWYDCFAVETKEKKENDDVKIEKERNPSK